MTKEYTGFAISNFRVGFDEAVEPWLLPRDAFQVLRNAHLYRGVVEKIPGYLDYARMSYITGVAMTGVIDGANKTFTATLAAVPSTGGLTIQAAINAGATLKETFADNGSGVLIGSNTGTGTINYVADDPVVGQPAGYVTVTFGLAAPANITVGGTQYNSVLLFSSSVPSGRPIMGIKQYIADSGAQDIVIFDDRRAGIIVELTGLVAQQQQSDYGIEEIPHEAQTLAITTGFNGTIGPYTGTVSTFLVPGEVKFYIYVNNTPEAALWTIVSDNGSGGLTDSAGHLDPAQQNLINYSTGQWRMQFINLVPDMPLAAYQTNFSGCVYGNIFTGDFTNFFSTVNFQGKLFLTNFIDPPMYYDGSCLKFLNTNLSSKPNTVAPYDISRVLHVTVNQQRLILISVFVMGVPQLSTIYWSKFADPLDFTQNELLPPPTSEVIRTFSFINTDMVVRFSNSERIFRYTQDAFSPFRWDSTNSMWRCDASYSAINYDSWFSSVGRPAIVGSDGVNVKRVDEIIPDFTNNLRISDQQPVLSIDQGSISQCYGERFDDFKEGWMCYRDFDTDSDGPVKKSNSVLAFNYLDNTYAVYTFPFSCLGFGRIVARDVWENNFDLWDEALYTWDTFTQTFGALIDLAGDQNGKVYKLGVGNTITNLAGTRIPCLFEAITKDFNPFVEAGELVRLGYVDFLVSSNDDTRFRVQFYKDNQMNTDFDSFYQETRIELLGGEPNTQYKIWKRIYVGAVGKEHTMRIYQNAADFDETHVNQPIRIHAIVPYFKAAGRLFS